MPTFCSNPECQHPDIVLPCDRWDARSSWCDECLDRAGLARPRHVPAADVVAELRRDHRINVDTAIARARSRLESL